MTAKIATAKVATVRMSSEQSDFRQSIDWNRPWMASLRDIGLPLCAPEVDWRWKLNTIARDNGLATENGKLIEFVAQSELPAHTNYEVFIHATGKVPTRENLHDFLNAIIWLNYPRIKARLNAVHATDVNLAQAYAATATAAPMRSRLRDALTLFDENAVLVACSEPMLLDFLRMHAWSALFLDHRAIFNMHCEVFVFGHALVEKLASPYKAITAHAWLVPVDTDFFAMSTTKKKTYLDVQVASQLDYSLRTPSYTPLPVLGIPNWWDGQDAFFYADEHVFRPLRTSSKTDIAT